MSQGTPAGQFVESRLEQGVRTVSLNRPEKRNALTDEMLQVLLDIFNAEPDPSERVVVLRGEGASFCSGRDISQGMEMSIEPMFHAVERYPVPVVAAVQGSAIAGGCELALHCDFIVAMSDAQFGMSLVQIGMAPSWFLAKKLLEVAGPVGAREILLLGDPIPAGRMFDLGLVTRITNAETFEESLRAIVSRLVKNAPLALKATKMLLLREMAYRDGIEHADIDELIQFVRNSEDAREGKEARLAKRPAEFSGK